MPTADSPYVKVFVSKSGELTLDGKPTDLEGLKPALASLAQKKGLVLYAREDPEAAEPPPIALEVMKLVVKNKLPVRLCQTKDCSDALDANGKSEWANKPGITHHPAITRQLSEHAQYHD